ncbi:MAG: hypothetical protein WD276_06980 [Actinomycetota bacterium]
MIILGVWLVADRGALPNTLVLCGTALLVLGVLLPGLEGPQKLPGGIEFHYSGTRVLGTEPITETEDARKVVQTLQAIGEEKPRLVFNEIWGGWTSVESREEVLDPATGFSFSRRRATEKTLEVIGVRVKNDPPGHPRGAVVEDAVVKLEFFSRGAPFLETEGRWTDNPQLIDLDRSENLAVVARRTLPPNGESHRMDIAVKDEADQRWWAAGLGLWQSSKAEDPSLELPEDNYTVRITISGSGLPEDKSSWFDLAKKRVGEFPSMKMRHLPNGVPPEEGDSPPPPLQSNP